MGEYPHKNLLHYITRLSLVAQQRTATAQYHRCVSNEQSLDLLFSCWNQNIHPDETPEKKKNVTETVEIYEKGKIIVNFTDFFVLRRKTR